MTYAIVLEVYSSSDKTQLFRQNHGVLAKLVQLEIERNRRNEYFHENFHPGLDLSPNISNTVLDDWTEWEEW